MLYKFLYGLKDYWFGFNVFRYITVRTVLAIFTSLLISILSGPFLIRKLKNLCHPSFMDNFRKDKSPTPTMGGILIHGSIIFAVLLWTDLKNIYILLSLAVILLLFLLGLWDDYLKLKTKSHKGLRPLVKIIWQIFVGLLAGIILYYHPSLNFNPKLYLPFFKKIFFNLGPYYILLIILIIVATSNAVNLTDGMDGLAIGNILIVALTYGVMAYVAGNIKFATYLNIPYVSGAGELAVLCGGILGACLGFLWYNCYPAEIFMGDTGSLPLGGIIGFIAVCVKQEIPLIFVGGIFVIEALSVIIQVISFKWRGKRVFLMSPLHHHFELKGWKEPKVVVRFWILGIIFALFALMTLKIR